MWLFTKHGHLSLANNPFEVDHLIVRSQLREDLDKFLALLDEIGGRRHVVQEDVEDGYRFLVNARKTVVAQAVAHMVSGIDYGRFVQSFHFDFGKEPGFLLWMNPNGLQLARVKPD